MENLDFLDFNFFKGGYHEFLTFFGIFWPIYAKIWFRGYEIMKIIFYRREKFLFWLVKIFFLYIKIIYKDKGSKANFKIF